MSDTTRKEPPPMAKSIRTMAVVRWVLLAFVGLIAAGTWWAYVFRTEPATSTQLQARYYCPMHPQIQSTSPGTCAICGMTLMPIPEQQKTGLDSHVPKPTNPVKPQMGQKPEGLSELMLTPERRQSVGIATAAASRRSVSRKLSLPAVIDAPEKAVSEVRVRTAGFVERVASVETGQRVQAGQPLVWIYSPELLRTQEELLTAQKLSNAEKSSDASAAESEQHPLGNQVLEAAKQRLALLGLDAADINQILKAGQAQRLVPIRAPASGVVTSRQVAVGTYAAPEMLLFEITDLSRVWATATVAAEDLSLFSSRVSGHFVSRHGARNYPVKVALIEPLMAAETRTGRVRFIADNTDNSLRPGDIGEVAVELTAQEFVLVPRDAVIDTGSFLYVFVTRAENVFTPRIIEAGPLFGDERAIVRGLEEGELVVARGAFLLDSESRLQGAFAPAAPPHSHGSTP